MKVEKICKIVVIGNVASGKTYLSKYLSVFYHLPITHIDSIQFTQDLKIKNLDETRKVIQKIASQSEWLIDGYGPLDILEERLIQADKIVFIDFPVWRNYFWLIKRQIKNIFKKREEWVNFKSELNYSHTKKLFASIGKMHHIMRPQMLMLLGKENLKNKVVHVTSWKLYSKIKKMGL